MQLSEAFYSEALTMLNEADFHYPKQPEELVSTAALQEPHLSKTLVLTHSSSAAPGRLCISLSTAPAEGRFSRASMEHFRSIC